jgi:hypothetical protein
MPGVKASKNPDFRMNNDYVELKNPTSLKKTATRIREGAEQANHVIVNLNHNIQEHSLRKIAKRIYDDPQVKGLKTIEYRHKGKYLRIDR